MANIPNLLRHLHEGLFLSGSGVIVGVGVVSMLFEQMREILIKTDLEE